MIEAETRTDLSGCGRAQCPWTLNGEAKVSMPDVATLGPWSSVEVTVRYVILGLHLD